MTRVVTIRDGLGHRVTSREADARIVATSCGLRVVVDAGRPDHRSAYQRATRHDWTATPCGACS
jgi:hypothetical protein